MPKRSGELRGLGCRVDGARCRKRLGCWDGGPSMALLLLLEVAQTRAGFTIGIDAGLGQMRQNGYVGPTHLALLQVASPSGSSSYCKRFAICGDTHAALEGECAL
jgi:hypothetical protein